MSRDEDLVLALYPFTRGCAYVLFQGRGKVLDWEIKEIPKEAKNSKTMEIIRSVIDRYAPDVIVLEDVDAPSSRRSLRIRALHRTISEFAITRGVRVARYSREEIRRRLLPDGRGNKDDLAQAVADELPVLALHLPPRRKFFNPEDRRLSLFLAGALGLAYYATGRE